jgi:hypothetical protein
MEKVMDKLERKRNKSLKPLEAFVAPEVEIEDIHKYIGKREIRTVSKEGVQWNNRHYWGEELQELVGKKVVVIEDIYDISKIHISRTDHFLSENFLKNVYSSISLQQEPMTLHDAKTLDISIEEYKRIKKNGTKEEKELIRVSRKFQDYYSELNTAQYRDDLKEKEKKLSEKPAHQIDAEDIPVVSTKKLTQEDEDFLFDSDLEKFIS